MRYFVCRFVECDRSFRRLCCQPRLCLLHLRSTPLQAGIETRRIVLNDQNHLSPAAFCPRDRAPAFWREGISLACQLATKLSPRACKSTPARAALHLGSADAAFMGLIGAARALPVNAARGTACPDLRYAGLQQVHSRGICAPPSAVLPASCVVLVTEAVTL